MASKAESRLRGRIKKAILHKYGEEIYIAHPHGSQFSAGLPDLHGCLGSQFFALEVKMPDNRRGATPLQQAQLDAIERAGGIARVVRSPQEALEALNELEKQASR